MFRNHRELVDFWKVRNLFEELSSLDNDVEDSFRKITNFPFNIKYSNLSTKLSTILTKLSEIKGIRQCLFPLAEALAFALCPNYFLQACLER